MIKIRFDNVNNPLSPTLILATRSGKKLGQLNAKELDIKESMNDSSELNFRVYKRTDGQLDPLWDMIKNFRLVWWKEQDKWYECTVDVDEGTETTKTVYCVELGKAELSEIKLYDVEINTTDDIARDDYEIPTTFYNEEHPEASLLNRVLEKAPHYHIAYVDDSLKNIQRTFTFNDKSIYDSLKEIAEEIGCLFLFEPERHTDDGIIQRAISAFDLQFHCANCDYRGEEVDVCPNCGSSDIMPGYGEDTTIFVTADELASDIGLTSDTDAIRNCYKIVAGDDLMTATVRNANPNGTEYIWYFPDEMLEDVSPELYAKLIAYQTEYDSWMDNRPAYLDATMAAKYNALIDKYSEYDPSLERVESTLYGYHALTKVYYDTLDFGLYLKSALMPSVSMEETTAQEQLQNVVSEVTEVAVANTSAVAVETVNSVYKQVAGAVLDYRYNLTIDSSSLDTSSTPIVWHGVITVKNVSNEEDVATSETLSVTVTDNYEEFTRQKIERIINRTKVDNVSMSGLFKKPQSEFEAELKKYCLDSLSSMHDLCQAVVDIIVEQGVLSGGTWARGNAIYDNLYIPYKNKLEAIEAEMSVREDEIKTVSDLEKNADGLSSAVKTGLNLKSFLGDELWLEFSAYRREDKYDNSNYASDGLSNAEMLSQAVELIGFARDAIQNAYETQYSIKTTLNNLLHIEKFAPLVDHFSLCNWIRIRIDGQIYRLRLVEYEVHIDDFSEIDVDFADARRWNTSSGGIINAIKNAGTQSTGNVDRRLDEARKEIQNLNDTINNLIDRANRGELDGADGRQGEDGESAFYTIVESSAGNVFKNKGINTVLTAHAYYGSEEVTADVTKWTWKKNKADGTEDTSWTRVGGNTITITQEDVDDRAVFYCYAEYDI